MNDVVLLKSGLGFVVYKYFVNSVVITKEVCLEKEYGIISHVQSEARQKLEENQSRHMEQER